MLFSCGVWIIVIPGAPPPTIVRSDCLALCFSRFVSHRPPPVDSVELIAPYTAYLLLPGDFLLFCSFGVALFYE